MTCTGWRWDTWRSRALGGALLTAAAAAAGATAASATAGDRPSDGRATFVTGNATTCSDVGFASDTPLGSTGDAHDANVSGTVTTNAGSRGADRHRPARRRGRRATVFVWQRRRGAQRSGPAGV
jgi:hypothetical protein